MTNEYVDKRGDEYSISAGRLNVAVLMGGASSERGVSLATGREIVRSLDKSRYCVKSIDTGDLPHMAAPAVAGGAARLSSGMGDGPLPSAAITDAGTKSTEMGFADRPDVVFIALHGKGGEDGSVQGLLEVLGLPYTGSGVLASALAMNKTMSKRLFATEGIPAIPGVTVSRLEWNGAGRDAARTQILDTIGCPVFVKPNAEGSTFGCSLVESAALLDSAIDSALTYDSDALIERYTRGTEITVGVLEELDGGLQCLPPVEIVPRSSYYDYESKYAEGGSEHIIPARIGDELTSLAWSYAVKCHTLLGCRGMSRTDMIVADDGMYVLEVNTIPGMTPTSLLPQAAAHIGISFSELLDRMIDSALRSKG
jgi:D-alanine-D-alanine ligase